MPNDEDRGFLKGIKPSTFLSTHEEWHAFVEGFCESFCIWKARYEPSQELLAILRREHHYYSFGRFLGFAALILTVVLAVFKITKSKRTWRQHG